MKTILYLLLDLILFHTACAQSVVNGSLDCVVTGNNMIDPSNIAGWTVCGGSPDLTHNGFASYVAGSQVTSCASPDGDPRLGLASLSSSECAQTTITDLTVGETYYLCFYGACFGTGTTLFNNGPVEPVVCVGNTCITLNIPMEACSWNMYSLTFIADNTTMILRCSYLEATNFGYASLDGFHLSTNSSCAIPLGSRFQTFEAHSNHENHVLLHLDVNSSSVGDQFILERFTDKEKTWSIIEEQLVTQEQKADYRFIDYAPHIGENYYRVMSIGKDGELKETTEIRIVRIDYAGHQKIRVFPNPANDQLNIHMQAANTHLTIYSSQGLLVYENSSFSKQDTIDISRFEQGIYLIRINDSYERFVKE